MYVHYRPLFPVPPLFLFHPGRRSKFVKPQSTCSFYLFDVLFRVHRAAAGASKPRRTIEKCFALRATFDWEPPASGLERPLTPLGRLLSIDPSANRSLCTISRRFSPKLFQLRDTYFFFSRINKIILSPKNFLQAALCSLFHCRALSANNLRPFCKLN